MTVSVVRAFRHSGGLKAGTPFETASTPVIALQPSAKARISRSTPSDSAGTTAGVTPVTCGRVAEQRPDRCRSRSGRASSTRNT